MPKQGPSEGSRSAIMARLPICRSPSPSPTVVVVLPSPAGVGLMAVTRMSLPFLRFRLASLGEEVEPDLADMASMRLECAFRDSGALGDRADGLELGGAGDLDI